MESKLYILAKEKKRAERESAMKKRRIRRLLVRALWIIITVAAVGALLWYAAAQPDLPPTSAQGHLEDIPQAHISSVPIPDAIQRHMLEHADGKGNPGIIIQYNCQKYSCAPDLVAQLTDLVKQYPDNVYLAPNNYDGKIILTKLGQLKMLDHFEEGAITTFISR